MVYCTLRGRIKGVQNHAHVSVLFSCCVEGCCMAYLALVDAPIERKVHVAFSVRKRPRVVDKKPATLGTLGELASLPTQSNYMVVFVLYA